MHGSFSSECQRRWKSASVDQQDRDVRKVEHFGRERSHAHVGERGMPRVPI